MAGSGRQGVSARAAVGNANDWRPYYSAHELYDDGSPYIWQSFGWVQNGLAALPDHTGLEFEINLENPNVAAPDNIRPFCFDYDYKSRFWVQNQNYSWSVMDINSGSGNALGAYADYNDLSDKCRSNSISVGLRWPKNLVGVQTSDGIVSGVEVSIEPPRGLNSRSFLAGNVQAVSDLGCEGLSMSYTDCMGVRDITKLWNGGAPRSYNRATLGASRKWLTPLGSSPLKWKTSNYGASLSVG